MIGNHKELAEWLASLKPGDEVAISTRSTYSVGDVAAVERTTKTQIVIGRQRFRRSDGRAVGNPFCRLYPVTDDFRDRITRRDLARWIEDLSRHGSPRKDVTTAQLVAMKAAFDAAAPKEGEPCSN